MTQYKITMYIEAEDTDAEALKRRVWSTVEHGNSNAILEAYASKVDITTPDPPTTLRSITENIYEGAVVMQNHLDTVRLVRESDVASVEFHVEVVRDDAWVRTGTYRTLYAGLQEYALAMTDSIFPKGDSQ